MGALSTVLAVTLRLVAVRNSAGDGAAMRERRGAARTRCPCGRARALCATGGLIAFRTDLEGRSNIVVRVIGSGSTLSPIHFTSFLLSVCTKRSFYRTGLGTGLLPERLWETP